MQNFYLNACGIVCALGDSLEQIRERLYSGQTGVAMAALWSPGRELPLGCVQATLPPVDHLMQQFRSRNNALALAALSQIRTVVDSAITRYGADRIGVVIGTSTSGIGETEQAFRQQTLGGSFPSNFHYGVQEMGSPAALLALELGLTGPAYVHSSACSSSAKAMASAARLIKMGLCDAVVTGGVDTLCEFTVAGFSALDSVSARQCNPMSINRDGINIGEGAALFLMSRDSVSESDVSLLGWGESSDGHHMSAPDPEGGGARLAITQALLKGGIEARLIDYINLHGTATKQNDAMEAGVIAGLFGLEVPVSSTKPFTGHTLGAAAAIEAALCWLVMQNDNPEGRLPPHLWDGEADPVLPVLNLIRCGAKLGRPVRHALSTSFAFGGSNAALLLGRAA